MKKTFILFLSVLLLFSFASCNLFSQPDEEPTAACDGHVFKTTVTANASFCSVVKTCTKCGLQTAEDHPVTKGLVYERIGDTDTASVSLGTCTDLELYLASEVDIDGTSCKVVKLVDFMDGKFFDIYIPNGITSIEALAFMGCNHIVEINLPDSVSDLGDGAFMSCAALDFANLPATMTDLPNGLFQDCHGLKKVTPAAVVCNSNYEAFAGCGYFIAKNELESLE